MKVNAMVKTYLAITNLPPRYDFNQYENKWQKHWRKHHVYTFKKNDNVRPTYVIDTPPPYPSGEFHMGNALNWCYIDFIARYKRMRGYNVHFPQGWDCHGLPTEVRAETTFKVRKRDLPIMKFKELCVKLTNKYIKKMREAMKRIGFSIDDSLEYKTMDPDYYRLTQLSFIELYQLGKLYRGEHPVNWCPRCETAIAEAEVEYTTKEGRLNYILFKVNGKDLLIATTRGELLPACVAVAVHPDDDRYKELPGKTANIPLFNRTVPIISDREVDPHFGTGVVMICTFGDKTDVRWQKRHDLPIVNALTDDGKMTSEAGRYRELTVKDARERIINDLNEKKLITKEEKLTQNVGTCWRCHTPIEILAKQQWFMKTRDMTSKVLEWSEKIKWIPNHAKNRLQDWAKSLDWDWVISRQRIFATPIPVWYCRDCKEIVVAKKEELPVDPRFENPTVSGCPKCGSTEFIGESDVMDTWMDSSITCAVHAGWPDDQEMFERLFPADLQPNGLDIIRTWDYYLLVKHLALFGKAPYKNVLVNGMVRGADGRMMHKSYGNYVEAGEVLDKYGADALRQWSAAGGATGNDIPFKWSEVEHSKKFLTKFWNATRFILSHLHDYEMNENKPELELLDRWILSKLEHLITQTTDSFEKCQFNTALESLRHFSWHILCDQYLEAVKYRLYSESAVSSRYAAQYTLQSVLTTLVQLLAPICPYITETIYQLTRKKTDQKSTHLVEWPKPTPKLLDKIVEEEGNLIIEIITILRREKAQNRIPLKEETPLAIIKLHDENQKKILLRYQTIVTKICRVKEIKIEEKPEKMDITIDIPTK